LISVIFEFEMTFRQTRVNTNKVYMNLHAKNFLMSLLRTSKKSIWNLFYKTSSQQKLALSMELKSF